MPEGVKLFSIMSMIYAPQTSDEPTRYCERGIDPFTTSMGKKAEKYIK